MRYILGLLLTEVQAYVKYKAALRDLGNKTDSRGLWKAFTSAFILTDPDSAIDAIEAGIADLHWEGAMTSIHLLISCKINVRSWKGGRIVQALTRK